MTPCETLTEEFHQLGYHQHDLYPDHRRPLEWKGENMKDAIRELLNEIPLDRPNKYIKELFSDIVYVKIDGKS